MFEPVLNVYHTHHKKLLVFSLTILLVCTGFLLVKYGSTGSFAPLGVSLKGGITLTVPVSNVDSAQLQTRLAAALPAADINVRGITEGGVLAAIIIEAADVEEKALLEAVAAAGIQIIEGKFSIEIMGSSLGESFFRQTIYALIIAFICMSLVVYITFRSALPSFFVVLAAFSDIISTLAVVSFLDVKLSTAGIAAFLMLIGYSVDTDILLTTRVLKRKEGTLNERIESALRTGLTMTITSLAAVMVAFFMTDSDVIRQIMLILMIGLLFDMIYTWAQNAGILRMYLERKAVQHAT